MMPPAAGTRSRPADGAGDLDAGNFSAWIGEMRAAVREPRPVDVPCGQCTACCTSGQFVSIAPDEVDTLAHIPAALLFPAPRMPKGHMVLGYDEQGHCPMLVDGRCSIYDHRPRTCATYDCRIFAAAGVDPGDGQPAVAARARRWRFHYETPDDRAAHDAVRAAAAGVDPAEHPIRRALLAVGATAERNRRQPPPGGEKEP